MLLRRMSATRLLGSAASCMHRLMWLVGGVAEALAPPNLCKGVSVVVCRTENDASPHGISDEYPLFLTSLRQVQQGTAELSLQFYNACEGLHLDSFRDVFVLKTHAVHHFLMQDTDDSCSRVFMYVDAADVFFNQPVGILWDRFLALSEGGRKVVLATEMSCWLGRVCTADDERRWYPNRSAAVTTSSYVNAGGIIGSRAAMLRMYSFVTAASPDCDAAWADDQCDFARFAREFVPSGLAVLDERQLIFGSLLVSERRGSCPGPCADGPLPLLCACLSCGGEESACVGNAAFSDDELDAMFHFDGEACQLHRVPSAWSRFGRLEQSPVVWHGHGPGKVTLRRHSGALLRCLQLRALAADPAAASEFEDELARRAKAREDCNGFRFIASPSEQDAMRYVKRITSTLRFWPREFNPASCDTGVNSKWGAFKDTLQNFLQIPGGHGQGTRLVSFESLYDMAHEVSGCFGSCGDTTIGILDCPLGFFAAGLVSVMGAVLRGAVAAMHSVIYYGVPCGVEGLFRGYLQHVVLSGWPILRLVDVLSKSVIAKVRHFSESVLLHLHREHHACRHCDLNPPQAPQTLCDLYGYRPGDLCPLERVRSDVTAALEEVNTAQLPAALQRIEEDVLTLLTDQATCTSERSFLSLVDFLHNSFSGTFCKERPRLFLDFAVLGLWTQLAELEAALAAAPAAALPASRAEAALHAPLLAGLASRLLPGPPEPCPSPLLSPSAGSEEAWVTMVMARGDPEQVMKYAEAARVLFASLKCLSSQPRDLVVLTDGTLPDAAAAALVGDGAVLRVVDTQLVDEIIAAGLRSSLQQDIAWNQRRGLHTIPSLKFYLWTLVEYKRLVYLDADMLVLSSIEELFDVPPSVTLSDSCGTWWLHGRLVHNYGLISLAPSMKVFGQMLRHTPECLQENYQRPVADLTDATILDCAWRQMSLTLDAASFDADVVSQLPSCSASSAGPPCISSSFSRGDSLRSFVGCFGSDQVFHNASVLSQSTGRVRCVVPTSYAVPVDLDSIMMLVTRTFHYGPLKEYIPLSQQEALDKFAHALTTGTIDSIVHGLKVLHWPTGGMKPWDHCAASRSAFDSLWWDVRRRLCDLPGSAPCRSVCTDTHWF